MSNFKLKNPNCVLIHIPKTGGTSIRKGLWGGNYEGPEFGNVPPAWRSLFKFAFVRHPFDRLVSAWTMFASGPLDISGWREAQDWRPISLNEFIEIVLDENIIYDERRRSFDERIRHHTIPQTHPFNCLNDADFVGRFEHLEEDIDRVAKIVGLNNYNIQKLNHTSHRHWSAEMNQRQIREMFEYYRRDFEELGYEV